MFVSGLTHGKENRHIHQPREGRGSPVHHRSRTRSKTPDRSPHGREHSKTTCKHNRHVSDNVSSRASELLERDVEVPVKHRRRRIRPRRGAKKRSPSTDPASTAKKPKLAQSVGNSDLNNEAVTSALTIIDASEENSLKRKLLTMGALPNQSQRVTTVPSNEVECMPNNSAETEVLETPVTQVSSVKPNGAVSKGGSGKDDVEGVIFLAAVPKNEPELVTLSDSDAEQDAAVEIESNDITKGATDMEMSRSSASSNIDMDLDPAITEVPANATPAQLDHDDEDIVSLRRAALMSK